MVELTTKIFVIVGGVIGGVIILFALFGAAMWFYRFVLPLFWHFGYRWIWRVQVVERIRRAWDGVWRACGGEPKGK